MILTDDAFNEFLFFIADKKLFCMQSRSTPRISQLIENGQSHRS